MVEPKFLILDDHLAGSIQNAIDKTFSSTFSVETKMEVWSVAQDISLNFEAQCAAKITLMQENIAIGVFIAAFNQALLLKLLKLNPSPQNIDIIEDAASEITNILFGLFKSAVNNEGYKLTMGLPVSLHNQETIDENLSHWEKFCLSYSVDGQKCLIAIAQNH